MPATELQKTGNVIQWLEENAFWNTELVEVKHSALGGVGVFWKLGPQCDPENDTLLLRIPKSNILSPKNSFLFSLLVDHESADPSIDLSCGMHSIVITFIYESAMGESSPWHAYLTSFSWDDDNIPICLWPDEDKKRLRNTECDLLNMLDSSELTAFYHECVYFARQNRTLVPIPHVFAVEGKDSQKLHMFGQYVQAVISRAFTVDKFHGLSLVPGADLFNHLSPTFENSKIQSRENVHFMCDDGEDLCPICGEIGCPHMEVDESETDSEASDSSDDEAVSNTPMQLRRSSSESIGRRYSNTPGLIPEHDSIQVRENDTITMSDIERLEMGSEADSDHDEENASTVSLSEDEKSFSSRNANQIELANELADNSKCCDIVLTSLPSESNNYELFNTYGNELSNAYLLQRYGFVSKGNPNSTCLLSVPIFAYLKHQKQNPKTRAHMEKKLEWYEGVGFSIVNDICVGEMVYEPDCSEDSNGDSDDNENVISEVNEVDVPENWALSAKLLFDGSPSKQMKALVRLFQIPYSTFYSKLYNAGSERKLEKNIKFYLLNGDLTKNERNLLSSWITKKMESYHTNDNCLGFREQVIGSLIAEEKEVLKRAQIFLSQ